MRFYVFCVLDLNTSKRSIQKAFPPATPSWKLAPRPRSKHEKRTAGSAWETWTVAAADGVGCTRVRWEINFLLTFQTAPFFCVYPVYVCMYVCVWDVSSTPRPFYPWITASLPCIYLARVLVDVMVSLGAEEKRVTWSSSESNTDFLVVQLVRHSPYWTVATDSTQGVQK